MRNILGTTLTLAAAGTAIIIATDARSDVPSGFSLRSDAQAGRYHVRVEGGYAIKTFTLACSGVALVIAQEGRPSITVRSDANVPYGQGSPETTSSWPCPDNLLPGNRDTITKIVGRELKDSLSRQP